MIQPYSDGQTRPQSRAGRGIGVLILNFFSSVWTGVVLASLLFVYCSIGSAVPQVRQHPWLEMTEFQWFHWWPFNLLVILFIVTMAVVTVRRIPFRTINAGVWMIHSGIIMMTLGSYYYFTTKIEGDAPVFRRRVTIQHPSMPETVSLLAAPGNSTVANIGPDAWRFSIQSTNSEWPILSDEDKGKTAYAVNVQVTPGTGEPFVRQLLAGFPQYTEDVLPGKGRAIKAIGSKLVNDELSMSLDYDPQEYFHVMDTWALYVRKVGEPEWSQRPIRGLPRYNDRVSSRDQVFTDPHSPIEPRTLDIAVPPAPGGDALAGASVHITGYLRHARFQRRWREGSRFNPVLKLSLLADQSAPTEYELLALDPIRSVGAEGNVQFIWLNDIASLADLPRSAQATLRINVPEQNIELAVPLTAETVQGAGDELTPIEGSDFSYRIVTVHDNLAIPGKAETVSIVMVDIQTPEGRFTRMVANRPEMTRDMSADDSDPHAARNPEESDKRIVMTYEPSTPPILFAGHPGGIQFILNGHEGRVFERSLRVGDAVEVMSGVSLRVDGFWRNAEAEFKPFIVPPPQRDRNARETFAMIRLEIDTGRDVETRWVPFNQYALPSDEYAYRGRFAYLPERYRLPDGTQVEVLFSREREPLPAPVALDEFALDTHIGGYSGMASTIRNYVSRLRFLENGKWSEPTAIAVNDPTEHGGFWYFQSMWDKPPNNDPASGMNYTGLGVGNRHGVYVQLTGCVLSVIGMIFAFYVKPIVKRRRMERARAKLGRPVSEWETADVPAAVVYGETPAGV